MHSFSETVRLLLLGDGVWKFPGRQPQYFLVLPSAARAFFEPGFFFSGFWSLPLAQNH